jgi:hypothetical protein
VGGGERPPTATAEQQPHQEAARGGGGRAELLEFLGLRAGATTHGEIRAASSAKDG